MTPDQIIRWSKEADDWAEKHLGCKGEFHPDFHTVSDTLFAQLVAQHERERCAKVCEAQKNIEWVRASVSRITCDPANTIAAKCAAAIRALKD
jgi:hypothetical protein